MERGKSTSRCRSASWRPPVSCARSLAVAIALTSALTWALSGCSSIPQKFTESMSQMPAIGLPADAPERPAVEGTYPAVHDIPPPRNSVTLTSIEQQKMEDDLMAAHNQQQHAVGIPLQPKTKRQLRQERELQPPRPIVPVSSSRSIY